MILLIACVCVIDDQFTGSFIFIVSVEGRKAGGWVPIFPGAGRPAHQFGGGHFLKESSSPSVFNMHFLTSALKVN